MTISLAFVKNKILFILFLLLFLIDIALGGYTAYLFSPKISSLFYSTQNKSPVVTQILQTVGKKRTSNEYQNYINSISQVAITSNNMVVNNCSFSPLIIKTDKSSTLTFHNTGDKTIFISLAHEEPLRVEAQTSVSTSLSFVEGTPSIIGIGCSGKKEAAGIIYISK
jgi:hypothetical protein